MEEEIAASVRDRQLQKSPSSMTCYKTLRLQLLHKNMQINHIFT